jgi:acetylornithine deacetylase/succinyl-diaminopimelate desuccinylase
MISIDRSAITALLRDLVQAPSHPGVPRQEEKAAVVLANFFAAHEIKATKHEVRPGRPNVLANVQGAMPGRKLLLCGHTDTVPPNKITTMDPFAAESRDGRMYGRGTVDMKGALAAMAGALIALKNSNVLRRGSVTLAAVIDEEMESLGAEALIQSGFAADGAIVGEPTGNQIAIGHKGLEWLEVEFIGKATHGGTSEKGVNAISAAAKFIGLVEQNLLPRLKERKHPILGSPSLNFGTIHGGDQPSTVAAECKIQIDRRWIPSEEVELVFAELENTLASVRHEMPGLKTSLRRVRGGMAKMIHGPLEISPEHPLVIAAQKARQEICGDAGELAAFPAWTDGALLSREGKIPTLICGPGDPALAHSPEESIALEEVYQAAEIYAMTAIHFLDNS